MKRFFLFACFLGFSMLGAALPYVEFSNIRKNSSFGYEQHQLPSALRMLLTAADVARYQTFVVPKNKEEGFTKEVDRLKELLTHCPVPVGAHYVARKYAPATYDAVTQMCQRLNITTPLLYVATRGPAASSMEVIPLGGDYHAIVIGAAFLRRRTAQDCHAMMASLLAQISGRVCARAKVARLVWASVAGMGGIAYIAYLGHQAIVEKKGLEPFKAAALSWGGWVALLGASWLISEGVYAYLKRKYIKDADKDALRAFCGNEDEYAECLRRIYNDEQVAVAQTYGAQKAYFDYVRQQINQLSVVGIPMEIVGFLRRSLREQEHDQKKIAKPLHISSFFAKTPAIDERIAHVHEIDKEQHENRKS